MLCKIMKKCWTRDCRLLKPDDITVYEGDMADMPSYMRPLTDLEERRFFATATDEQLEALGQESIPPDAPPPPPSKRESYTTLADAATLDVRILNALEQLDHDDDEHWTSTGEPMMSAVESFLSDESITRADIKAVAPDFRRLS